MTALETSGTALTAEAPREKYEYKYNWIGRKIRADKYVYANDGWVLYSTNKLYYDNWNLIYETIDYADGRVPSGNKYYHGLDLQNTLYSTGGTGSVRFMDLNVNGVSKLVYSFNNITENIEALFSADGSNVKLAEYEYMPFGETAIQLGALSYHNPLRYNSQYIEADTGLVYYGYRHYSPSQRKWLSKDPISEEGGVNLYLMAFNTPNFVFDVNGRKCSMTFMHDHGPAPDGEAANMMLDHMTNNKDSSDMVGALSCYSNVLNAHFRSSSIFGPHILPNDYLGSYEDNKIYGADFAFDFDLNSPDLLKYTLQQQIMNWAENYAKNSLCNVPPDCCKSVKITIKFGTSLAARFNSIIAILSPYPLTKTYQCP